MKFNAVALAVSAAFALSAPAHAADDAYDTDEVGSEPRTVLRLDPRLAPIKAGVLPLGMPGFSDSHWFRSAFGATVFGFCPQREMGLAETRPLIHAPNERVAVGDVELMTSLFRWLPPKMLGTAGGSG